MPPSTVEHLISRRQRSELRTESTDNCVYKVENSSGGYYMVKKLCFLSICDCVFTAVLVGRILIVSRYRLETYLQNLSDDMI